jgi:hypothetical protein
MLTYSKVEAIAVLAKWFPRADLDQLEEFVDSGWDGDVDEESMQEMIAAWKESRDCEFPVAY